MTNGLAKPIVDQMDKEADARLKGKMKEKREEKKRRKALKEAAMNGGIVKINMESELTKSNKVIKFKEIQRKEFDPSHFYLIKKPLIPSIRGKILRNTKKRFEKPMRIILVDEKDYEPYFMGNY